MKHFIRTKLFLLSVIALVFLTGCERDAETSWGDDTKYPADGVQENSDGRETSPERESSSEGTNSPGLIYSEPVPEPDPSAYPQGDGSKSSN